MPGNSAVKSTARIALRRFWPQAIVVCGVLIAVFYIALYLCSVNEAVLSSFAPIVNLPLFAIFFVGVLIPLAEGIFRFFYKAVSDKVDRVNTIFHFFTDGRYFKSVFFALMLFVKLITVALMTYLPYLILRIVASAELKLLPESFAFYTEILLAVLNIVGTVLFVLATSKYYIAPMIYACRDDMNWTEVLYLAKHISRQTAGAFLVLLVGFTGWAALSLLGIPLLFTLPYFIAAYAVHCKYAFYHYNRNIDNAMKTEFPEYRSSF